MDGRPAVLLIDGHTELAETLERRGFAVTVAVTPESALFEYSDGRVDALVIAMPLPGLGTPELCAELRRRGRTPILVVTRTDDADWLATMDAGADDHLALPCEPAVLDARIHALIRRTHGSLAPPRRTTIGPITIVLRADAVEVQPRLDLSPLQAQLLSQLVERSGTVVTERAMVRRLPHRDRHRVIDELRSLQRLLANASGTPDTLQHIPGGGWRLVPAPFDAEPT